MRSSSFTKTLEEQERIYALIKRRSQGSVWRIEDRSLFEEVLEHFGPMLKASRGQHDLMSLYDVAFHKLSGALIIANKGATLFSLAPRTRTPHIIRHIGLCIYIREHGIEMINVGLVGNVYQGNVFLRSESACTPSFLFGSQRCNCAHQWDVFREVAASYNKIIPPEIEDGEEFEKWVQCQHELSNGRSVPRMEGIGFILMHIDTQNGMGSGYTKNEFSHDLYTRASMRHRAEYTSEQVWQTTMAGGFHAIGINPDPRHENGGSGYSVTPIVLDFLEVSKDLVFLTNNPYKIGAFDSFDYNITRMKCIGEVSAAGAKEAYERGVEFSHLSIDGNLITFDEEFDRISSEIKVLSQKMGDLQHAS